MIVLKYCSWILNFCIWLDFSDVWRPIMGLYGKLSFQCFFLLNGFSGFVKPQLLSWCIAALSPSFPILKWHLCPNKIHVFSTEITNNGLFLVVFFLLFLKTSRCRSFSKESRFIPNPWKLQQFWAFLWHVLHRNNRVWQIIAELCALTI